MKAHLLAAVMVAVAASSAEAKYVYGPTPEWERYKALGEAAVRAKLPDSDNWIISFPYGYRQGGWMRPKRESGYLTCGTMQAKVKVPGRDLVEMFAVVIDQDRVKTIDFATRQRGDHVNLLCPTMIRKGAIPPASLIEGPQSTMVPSLGITIRSVAAGAYVSEVAPGSAALRAGLKSGIVITHANGVALADLGQAAAKVLGAGAGELTLQTAAGEQIVVKP